MRGSRRSVAALTALLSALVVTACAAGSGAPTPIPSVSRPPDPFKAPLQPLDLDTAWWYENPETPGEILFVNTVIGEDSVDDRRVRLLQLYFGAPFSVRLACYVEDGDVYVAAIDTPGEGGWQRDVLAAPQLFRPGPGSRSWTQDFTDGPSIFAYDGTWEQRDSGSQEVLGTARQTWTASGTLTTSSSSLEQEEVVAESIGVIRTTIRQPSQPDATPAVHQLMRVTHASAMPSGVWVALTPTSSGQNAEWAIDFGATPVPRFFSPIGDVALSDFASNDNTITFTAGGAAERLEWSGRLAGAGLSGIAELGEQRFVLDFRPYPDAMLPPAAAPSASPSGVLPG